MSTQITKSTYDRTNDLMSFDERKTGIKGLIDKGTNEVPRIFVRPVEDRSTDFDTCPENISVPVIDLAHINRGRKPEIIKEMLSASEKWGFFQVVNHGIPIQVLDNMIKGIKMFHEQENEIKKQYYTRDGYKVVNYNTNYDLYKSKAANWRDSLTVSTLFAGSFDPQEFPPICREMILDYINHTLKLSEILLELLSLALGLEPGYLKELEGRQGWTLAGHYHPACPQPELTLGVSKHTDSTFITLLLQDHIGGLQVLHDNQWVNVVPQSGALIINIGDLLQMISNDKLKSVNHRVIAKPIGPRISVALFITGLYSSPKIFGPIKEILSEENQPIYKDFTLEEFHSHFYSRPVDQSGLDYFKL